MSDRVMTESCIDCDRTGMVYGGYGRCRGCYMRTIRRADPDHAERSREISRRWKREHREQNRARDRQRQQDIKKPCPICGQPMNPDSEMCRHCFLSVADTSRSLIVGMWADNWTLREIADTLGTTVNSLGVTMVHMRRDGWDLPYRYRVANGKRVAA